jgi:FemAB-related protein (PEP-CTERM system-associated)
MSPLPLRVRAGTAVDDAVRDAFVLEHTDGSFFHLAGWRRAVERVMGHTGRDVLAYRGQELVGVLPLMACRGLKGRVRLISMPYAVYGGPLGQDAEATNALVEHARSQADDERVGQMELRCVDDPGLGWPKATLHATFIKDLPAEPDAVLSGMPKKARAEARKARERHGLVHRVGEEHLQAFARLFHANKHALGSPSLPIDFFRALLDECAGNISVHVIEHEGSAVAAVMAFHHGGDFLAYYSGSVPGADRELSASNFMYLALQEWAVEQGFQRFDFGRSRKDSGAFRFKVHQGFEPHDLHYSFHLVRDGAPPSLNPSNPRLHLLQSTWRHLPQGMTRWLSGPLSRFLP